MTDSDVSGDAITAIESRFHDLIRRVARSMAGAVLPAALPDVEQGLRQPGPMWFPVPGMYGGFSWALHHEPEGPVLMVESWSRVVGGSGQRHRITRECCVLENEGFV